MPTTMLGSWVQLPQQMSTLQPSSVRKVLKQLCGRVPDIVYMISCAALTDMRHGMNLKVWVTRGGWRVFVLVIVCVCVITPCGHHHMLIMQHMVFYSPFSPKTATHPCKNTVPHISCPQPPPHIACPQTPPTHISCPQPPTYTHPTKYNIVII